MPTPEPVVAPNRPPRRHPENDAPRFLSVKQMGTTIGLSRSSVYDLIAAGKIRSCKYGTRILIPAEEADRFSAELLAQISGRCA